MIAPSVDDIVITTVRSLAPGIGDKITRTNAFLFHLGPPEPRTFRSRLADLWSRAQDAWLVLKGDADIA